MPRHAPLVRRHPTARADPRPADRRDGRQPRIPLAGRGAAAPDLALRRRGRPAARRRSRRRARPRPRRALLRVRINGVGRFEQRNAGALWAGVEPKEPLAALAAKVERICMQVGLEPERRAYHPHITLARWKGRRTREVARLPRTHSAALSPNRSKSTPSPCSKAASPATARIMRRLRATRFPMTSRFRSSTAVNFRFPARGMAVNKPETVAGRRKPRRAPGIRQLRDRRPQGSAVGLQGRRAPRHAMLDFMPRRETRVKITRKKSCARFAMHAAMVLVFSEAANISDEIKKELSLASNYKLPVLALRIEDAEPSDAFAYELSTRQWIDAFHGLGQVDRLDCQPHKADFRCGTGRHHGCRTASPPHNFRFAASDLDCGRGRLACAGNGWCVVVASTAPRGST